MGKKVALAIAGSWMVSVPGHPGPERQHWVRMDAKTEPYVYGDAPYSVCGTLCIPADAHYRQGMPCCERCEPFSPNHTTTQEGK